MHDGQMLFDSSLTWNHQAWGVDEVAGRLISQGKIHPCIIVGIWNSGTGRHSEYCPQEPIASLPQAFRDSLIDEAMRNADTDLFDGEIRSDSYLKFIVTELKPYIDNNYSTRRTRDNTFIAGSSMGGLISLYAMCEYPDVFGGAACLSTHWTVLFTDQDNPIPGTIMDYLEKNLPVPATHRIYFDYGTETLDSLYEPYQNQVNEIMKKKGYTTQNWKTLKFQGADHSEQAWRKRLDVPLVFLLGK
jgi:enterochelin esterase-like enzyme